ncbi:KilA-N domain-containing protein [Parvibaculum sp.]|uniref:KilA-N domain-containing protein n=1 Tax=Parvibaculum sp. TaxID=2024848 RepID=UPI000C89B9E1|nr:KilA-N domain-containing protein [Parvibaculum sp.]MAB15223.1 hypothetical protein [Parvibaculum sp.]
MKNKNTLKVRGKNINFDENGLACLGDIWKAAGFSKNQKPNDWLRLRSTANFVDAVCEKVTGKSRNWTKSEIKSVLCVKRGSGTFADVRLALAYAEYLNPKLAIEVKEVFLRYRGSDPTLADEVLQKASAEANEWVAKRAMGRAIRSEYTDQLDRRGVKTGFQYGNCTNATYQGLFGSTAKQLKQAKGLAKNDNLRDKMSMSEIAFVAAAEALSVERMTDEDSLGYSECRQATLRASTSIRDAIESDRKNRQKRFTR